MFSAVRVLAVLTAPWADSAHPTKFKPHGFEIDIIGTSNAGEAHLAARTLGADTRERADQGESQRL